MKKYFFALCALILIAAGLLPAQIDRSKIPPPGPAPAVAFPDYDVTTLTNGMRIIFVKNDELPTIQLRVLMDVKPIVEGEFAGYIGIAGAMLRNGTTTRTKDQLDKEIDQIGANISVGGLGLYANGLSKYTEKIVELMADILLNPSFPQEELDREKTQAISGLKYRKTDPNTIIEVVRQRVVYGDAHPYGETETETSIGKITREKCLEAYNTYFKSNVAIMAVVGNFDKKKMLSWIDKYFGKWPQGNIPLQAYAPLPVVEKMNVSLADRASSVQSVIRVTQTLNLPYGDPDVIPAQVMNTVLGGGVFRLFINLREKHSFTYGAYSSMGPDLLVANFTASTSVRNSVTDSALTEIFYEINRIRDEKVEAKELLTAKNYLTGNFVQSLENASSIAEYAIRIERFKLPKDYYKNYLKNIEAVTADDVNMMARKYLQPEKMNIVLVGSAKEVKEKLLPFGPVKMYDEDGNLIVEKPAPITVTADEIIAGFIKKIGGQEKMAALKDRTVVMNGKMGTFDMRITNTRKAPNKLYVEVAVGGAVQQRMGYNGQIGWATGPQGIMDLTGEKLDGLRAEAAFDFYSQYKSDSTTAIVSAKKTILGKDCYEVVFTAKTGSVKKQYFTLADSMKIREVEVMKTPMGEMEQGTDFVEYKDFNGLLFPIKMEQESMGRTVTMTVEKMEFNTEVKDKLFEKPSK